MTRIIVAFPKLENGKNIKNVLVRNGYQVVCVCTNGAQVIQEANGLQDGIVVCTYKLSDMIYQELMDCLPPGFELVVISTKDQWVENGTPGIVGLSVPLKIHELLSTVEMVAYNLERKRRKRRQAPRKRTKEEQELVARAKAILMERNQMTEDEAHRYLQKTSMDNGTSFTETAQMILGMLDQ
ncbi:ANTAR domain-containing protein [uncultured Eubacterium sp.]|uniref:ANTAR domain-containing response regulator n=1 Tax=uncultured Eubacterium sp. TaxID=165185 RepID=UPI0025D3609E|nr:ANTAR domain-containing protein [uncultured Eubacterium sp.]